MKVILLNRYFFPDLSATSQMLTDLAFEQAKGPREVHVITSRQRYEDAGAQLVSEERNEGVHVHRVWTSHFGRGNLWGRSMDYATFYVAAGLRLHSLAGPGDIIVAKTDPPLISVIAAWVARRRGAVLVNWIQDVFPEIAQRLGVRAMQGPLGSVVKRMRDYSLRSAKANVVLGERMADYVRRESGGAESSAQIIENWSDGASIHPVGHTSNRLRKEWNLDDRFVVGYSGNMGRAHEFDTILQSCELLRETGIVFLFIGAGRQRARIESEAVRRSLTNIQFQPYQPREMLAMSLSAADVHLVNLRPEFEGLIVPSKFYGVAAAGRPTIFIGDPDGEIARILERERGGIAVNCGDAGALASAILAFRDDPDLLATTGRRARSAFVQYHDRPVALARWEALLTSLSAVTPG